MNLDLTKPIPSGLCIPGADSHIYRIGLSLFNPQNTAVKRHPVFNPWFTIPIMCAILIKDSICLYQYLTKITVPELFHLIMCDVDHFLGTEFAGNIIGALESLYVMIVC